MLLQQPVDRPNRDYSELGVGFFIFNARPITAFPSYWPIKTAEFSILDIRSAVISDNFFSLSATGIGKKNRDSGLLSLLRMQTYLACMHVTIHLDSAQRVQVALPAFCFPLYGCF